MYKNDTHAQGSVDRVLFERMFLLDAQSVDYLYSGYTDLTARHVPGSRPVLEKIVRRLQKKSQARTAANIVRYCRKKVLEPCNVSTADMIFGGREEDIIARTTYWCTDLARVGCVLFQVAGLPARILVTANTNFAYCGHQVAEVYFDEAWHVADLNEGLLYPHSAWEIHNKPGLIAGKPEGYIFFAPGEQYQSVGISNYYVDESENYSYETSRVNDYCRAILAHSAKNWEGGIRWIHGEEQTMPPIPLGTYRHYKGHHYEVTGFARHSETLEDMVIYKALYGEGATWVRPLSMWDNPIDVNGKTVPRFAWLEENIAGLVVGEIEV
jgi:hypothetical protein